MNLFDDALREVLAGAKYDRLTGRAVDIRQILTEAAQRFIAFIFKHLRLDLPEVSEFNTNIVVYIFIVVGVVLLLGIAGVIIRLWLRRAKTVSKDLSSLFEEISKNKYTLAEWLHLSQERDVAGNRREAVRYRFIAALVGINERHSIQLEKSKTNAQLITELSAAEPSLALPFRQAVECFHWAWFGSKPVSEEQYARFVHDTNQVIRGVHEPIGAGGRDAS